jgi:DNA modification methylase
MNKIIQGNCLDSLKTLEDNSIDLTVTSPPYDNLRDYNGYTFDFEGIAKELYRVTKQGGVVVWVVGDATIKGSETGTSFKQALYFKEIGFNLHDTMIWEKQTFTAVGSLKSRYAPVFEYMFILSKGFPKTFNPIKDRKNTTAGEKIGRKKGIRKRNGDMIPNSSYGTDKRKSEYGQRFNIWKIIIGQRSNGHPAIFPEKLAEDHILSWSNEGDTVFDPMAGSGTTLKMAKKNKRNYIGIEISPEYIEIINARIGLWKNHH